MLYNEKINRNLNLGGEEVNGVGVTYIIDKFTRVKKGCRGMGGEKQIH